MSKPQIRPTTSTPEDQVKYLAKGWAYKQLVEASERLRSNPNDENAGLVEQAYSWVVKLFSAEFESHIKALYGTGHWVGIVSDKEIRAAVDGEHEKFIELARIHMPEYTRILDLLKKHREAEERKVL